VLIDAPDVDSAVFERRLTWSPLGAAGDRRNLVAIFTVEGERGRVGTTVATVVLIGT
jgi:hypothetical protein